MFKFELIIKYKSLSLARLGLAWLGLAWFISQAKLELNIKSKFNFNIVLLNLRFNIKYIIKPISCLSFSLFGLDEWSQLIIN